MDRETIQNQILNFIKREFKVEEDDDNFVSHCNLFEEGFVDSLGITKLISFLEETFGVEIKNDYFLDDRFFSIQGQADIIFELMTVE